MKIVVIFLFLLPVHFNSSAQKNVSVDYGLDTLFLPVDSCKAYQIYEYFQLNGKYPESSMSLLQRVKAKADLSKIIFTQNGFIAFRFTINCLGVASCYRLYLLDEYYRQQHFDKNVVSFFYDFVKSLNAWKKIPVTLKGEKAFYYNAYLVFQIKDGKILSIAP